MAPVQSPSGRPGDGPHRPARAWTSVVMWRLRRRLPHGTGSAPRAFDQRNQGGVLGVAGACKFLFFLPPARSAPPTCQRTRSGRPAQRPRRDPAADTHRSLAIRRAVHQALVNNSENTSATVPACGRSGIVTDWRYWRNRRAGSGCSATRGQTKQAEQAARGVRGGRGQLPRARAGIAKACRPLLIHGFARAPEPVRIRSSPGRRHGHARSRPPPSRPKESGERP